MCPHRIVDAQHFRDFAARAWILLDTVTSAIVQFFAPMLPFSTSKSRAFFKTTKDESSTSGGQKSPRPSTVAKMKKHIDGVYFPFGTNLLPSGCSAYC